MANPKFRGPLLKPGERGKSPARETRTAARVKPKSRYEELKHFIITWLAERFKIAEALKEIRDNRLYKDEYKTFEDFCMNEYGMTRAHAYRLIEAAIVKESVSPMGDILTNERQTRALSAVKETKRIAVLTRVVNTGPVTGAAISRAIKPRERKPEHKVIDVEPERKTPTQKRCPLCKGRGVIDAE